MFGDHEPLDEPELMGESSTAVTTASSLFVALVNAASGLAVSPLNEACRNPLSLTPLPRALTSLSGLDSTIQNTKGG